MKKRLFSVILATLMILPLGILGAVCVCADTDTTASDTSGTVSGLPAEPKLTSNTVVYYSLNGTSPLGATSNDNDGLSAATAKSSYGKLDGAGVIGLLAQSGGKIVIPGKSWGGEDAFVFEKAGGPIMFTAIDPQNNTDYTGVAENDDGSNGTQTGMWLWKDNCSAHFAGDYIFEDITILHRTASQRMHLVVLSGGNVVIGENVKIDKMVKGSNYGSAPASNPTIEVKAGGNLFLHSVGFSSYTGDGIIILDKALMDEGKITLEAFADFDGYVFNETGALVYDGTAAEDDTTAPESDSDTAKNDTTTKAPATTKAPDKTDKATTPSTTKAPATTTPSADEDASFPVWIVATIAAAAVAAVVAVIIIVKKKKAQ